MEFKIFGIVRLFPHAGTDCALQSLTLRVGRWATEAAFLLCSGLVVCTLHLQSFTVLTRVSFDCSKGFLLVRPKRRFLLLRGLACRASWLGRRVRAFLVTGSAWIFGFWGLIGSSHYFGISVSSEVAVLVSRRLLALKPWTTYQPSFYNIILGVSSK